MISKLRVGGMSCEMCVRHVTTALEQIVGVTQVTVDLSSGVATVEHENLEVVRLQNAIIEEGYEAEVL